MLKKLILTMLVPVTMAVAVPAYAQSIEIGPGGVRLVDPDEQRPRDHRGDQYRNRERSRDGVGDREAIRIARRQGVDEVDNVSRRRNVIIVEGVDRNNDEIRVVIDRRSGEVMSVR